MDGPRETISAQMLKLSGQQWSAINSRTHEEENTMRSKALVSHFCLAALLTSYSYAAESAYKYEVVAQSGVKIDGISLGSFGSVAMNDLGTVVFEAGYNDGSYAGASGVFSRNHALLKRGDIVRGLTVNRAFIGGINDFNELALSFSYGNGLPVALGKFVKHDQSIVPEGKLVKTGDAIEGLTIRDFRETTINDIGEIVFSADYSDSSGGGIGVFTRDRVLLKVGSEIKGIPLSGNNAFNRLYGLSDYGTLVFDTIGFQPGLGITQTGAFTQRKVLALAGDTVDGISLLGVFSPAISHFGRSAFTGEYANGAACSSCIGYAVFAPAGEIAKTGDTISGITLTDYIVSEGINDDGVVLMQANFRGGYGLFTKDSVVAATGDTLAGFQVEGFVNSQINDFGDVAFSAFEAVLVAKHKNGQEKHK